MGRIQAGVALVSGAALLLQLALTRVFAVVQWHHFAFMAVGLGLLGFGASGTALAVTPGLRRAPVRTAAWGALLVMPATAVALLAVALVPFDAYLMALEPVQSAYLAIQVAALVIPFFAAGLAVGAVLAGFPEAAGSLYAASFLGAGAGALAAVPILGVLQGPGAMILAGAVASAGAALLWWGLPEAGGNDAAGAWNSSPGRRAAAASGALALAAALTAFTVPFDLPLSPYKTLSQVRLFPDARVVFSRWSAVARVDVVRSTAVRSAPGMSVAFPGVPPSLPGLVTDGDGLRGLPADVDASFTEYLPAASAYRLGAYRLGQGRALIVGMGVEVLGALHHGMRDVAVLEGNPLVVEAAHRLAGDALARPRGRPVVRTITENPRTYMRRTTERFDVIQVPPRESFQVVASGAFSLAEHHTYTVEAFRDYVRALAPGGVLAVTRWIQTPPSEEIRVWGAAVAALEGRAPGAQIPAHEACLAALRSMNTMTILVKPSGFSPADVTALRTFAASRRFDITHAPGVPAWEGNRFNVLPRDAHRDAFVAILDPGRRAGFLRAYPFDVSPVRDGRPFFFHFFRWRQVPQILAGLGHTWQPFGGGGYLVLLVLLGTAAVLSAGLILIPLRALGAARKSGPAHPLPGTHGARQRWPVFAYFLALGVGYLFIEIPLLQQMILVLGHPTYAAAAVLAGLLLASGAGSLLAPRLGSWLPAALAVLAASALGAAAALPRILDSALGLPLPGRIAVLAAVILPLGLLMGMPFPAGIRLLGRTAPHLVPWAWGINGCASVVASILAAMVALEWGFPVVLTLGGIAYLTAGIAVRRAGCPP